MSSTSRQHSEAKDSYVKRATVALPLLVLPPFFYYAVTGINSESFWGHIGEQNIQIGDQSFDIAKKFHGSATVDDIWRGAVTVLTVSTLGWDGPSWWQTFSFLIDVSTIHSIFLVEACRQANLFKPAQVPVLFGLMFQSGGIGLTGGLYFFWLYVLTPISSLKLPENRRGDSRYTYSILPLLLLFSVIPLYRAYYAESLETRHWYMWAWQMFPLYVSLGQNFIAWISFSGVPSYHKENSRDATAVRVTIGTMALMSASVWIYAIICSPYSLQQMFLPDYFMELVPDNFIEQARHFLKWDQVCGSGSSLLWLLYSFSDLKRAKMTNHSWLTATLVLIGLTLGVGPGAAFAIGWLWRERMLLNGGITGLAAKKSLSSGTTQRRKAFR